MEQVLCLFLRMLFDLPVAFTTMLLGFATGELSSVSNSLKVFRYFSFACAGLIATGFYASSSALSYTTAVSPLMVTLLLRVLESGTMETELLSIFLRLLKFKRVSSSTSSSESLSSEEF